MHEYPDWMLWWVNMGWGFVPPSNKLENPIKLLPKWKYRMPK